MTTADLVSIYFTPMSISFHFANQLGGLDLEWQRVCIADAIQPVRRSVVMHRFIVSRTACTRSLITSAVFLCLVLTDCLDQHPTGLKVPPLSKTVNVPFNDFFVAWSTSGTYHSSPIQTQAYLDSRQYRQYSTGLSASPELLAFAAANPGKLYILWDEPDQSCMTPYDYAGYYHDFVAAVLASDATAKFSPSGFAEPNGACNGGPHSTDYAQQFYDAHIQRYGVAPHVDEWRFHNFALGLTPASTLLDTLYVAAYWARVSNYAAWSVNHGANLVLGGWAFLSDNSQYDTEHLKQIMGRLMNDSRINQAAYWSYEPDAASDPHPLTDVNGNLTAEGQTYANPLTDVPTGIVTAGASQGRARIQWTNTTMAWPAEAEFWVQPGGVGSFVYSNTAFVPGPGGTLTPYSTFNLGDRVKGRVRYYNVYGQAAWSAFSGSILIH